MKWFLLLVCERGWGGGGNLLAAFQFPPANPWNAPMLNRSAMIVRPKKSLLVWSRALDYDDTAEVTMVLTPATLYLVSDYADHADAEKILRAACGKTFRRESEGLTSASPGPPSRVRYHSTQNLHDCVRSFRDVRLVCA